MEQVEVGASGGLCLVTVAFPGYLYSIYSYYFVWLFSVFQLKRFCREVDEGIVSAELQEKLSDGNNPQEIKLPVTRESQDLSFKF